MNPAVPFEYVGSELTLFERARNWKQYWRAQIAPFIKGDVLEVGAGIGANTRLLTELPHKSWTCLEPDASLAKEITKQKVIVGTLAEVANSFDTIVYIDVLEHIQDDAIEMSRAARHLKPGGHLIVLSPAHQFLFAPFDKAVGHFRRYSKDSLREAAAQAPLREIKMTYLDSVGLLASCANRLLLKQSMPTEGQILTWDRLMIPASRVLDPITGGCVGKSIIGVWTRAAYSPQ
jgi:SAM-dependent methyltransferase